MRRLLLTALLVTAACEQRPPIPITYVTPAPAGAGTAAQQDSRRVNNAMGRETQQDQARDADPYAASMAGMPTRGRDLDVGANDVGDAVPQIGIPFNGI
jgi:hypothetical protein